MYLGFLPTTRLLLKSRVVHADNGDYVDNAGDCGNKVTGNDGRITNTDNDNAEPRFANNAQNFDIGGHSLCRLNTQRIWPRNVYLRITKECACSCYKQCVRVSVLTRDDVSGMSKLETFLQGAKESKSTVHVKLAANVESVPTSRCFAVIIRCVDTRNQKYLLDP